jgi:ABC-type xylose transport system permease subunit
MNCPFKNALGVPGEGFHSVRFMGVAVGDTVGTFILAWIVARLTMWDYLPTLVGLLIFGEILHWYFCVDTTVMKFLKGTIDRSE